LTQEQQGEEEEEEPKPRDRRQLLQNDKQTSIVKVAKRFAERGAYVYVLNSWLGKTVKTQLESHSRYTESKKKQQNQPENSEN
jgi:hypothetical protein